MQLNKSFLIKVSVIAVLLLLAPFSVPFALELVIFADFMGLEILVVLVALQFKPLIRIVQQLGREFFQHFVACCALLAELFLFEPKVLISHGGASSILLLVAGSSLFACLIWLPAIAISAGVFV
ncbi:MAG: hypothetical protein COC19_08620 [SAR86 cluster bacterium]|uniref:Uncharacterized protein n=1 Tax=SAR86 cluster bacterium TaxID=2030880 RepID=A0A2A4MF65_9GAMM|nr:MAG: hypothetical protein COC19_08620 [SAR86 cluster bacterium]